MDRYLSYVLLGEPSPRRDIAENIHLAQTMMNQRFTWSLKKPELLFDDERSSSLNVRFLGRDLLAFGETDIGPDDWNACLVVRLLKWISILLPEALVGVHDSGGYVLGGPIAFQGGVATTFATHIEKPKRTPRRQESSEELKEISGALDEAASGCFFAAIAARDYADRPEVRDIIDKNRELASASLEEVADHLVFPWDTEWLCGR